MQLAERLQQIIDKQKQIGEVLETGPSPSQLPALMREYSALEDLCRLSQEYLDLTQQRQDALELSRDDDPELREIAQAEEFTLREKLAVLEESLKLELLPKDADDSRNVMLELRAGTGGDEAALFAGDLLRMYIKYAEIRGWRSETMYLRETPHGGLKEGAISIIGKNVFERLKWEAGVHRVQRVPITETGGRIHTSAATIAILPEAEDVEVKLEDKDLRVDVFRASGAGGQHVNKTDSAIRVTHIPTNIVVVQQSERSQHRNRAAAMRILRSKIYDAQRQAYQDSIAEDRKTQVGSGDRSERIRTYNFPQGRVTDHRINLTLYKLPAMLEGEVLDEISDALTAQHQAQLLASSDWKNS